ncbi:MAG: TonB-dependent siderophore receptor [Verrucomicrobia bacterium]|nr:TonB-dependent siderophore receptor [Verrucomicrobiota bacterium]
MTAYLPCLASIRSALRAFFLCSLAIGLARGQAAPSPAPADAADSSKDLVNLPAFEVKSSTDQGYFAKQSISGMKTKMDLADTPGNITVIPRDLIDDIGVSESASDTLKFVASGVNPYVRGEQLQIRGSRTGFTLVDDIPDLMFFADNVGIDSYEILKGPTALLYGPSSSIFGLVIKTTKKPAPVFDASLKASYGSFGFARTDLDVTGPLGHGFSYRLIGAYQNSDGYNDSYRDDRRIFISSLQWRNARTTIRASYEHATIETGTLDANNVVAPGNVIKPFEGPRGWKFRYAPDYGTAGLYSNDVRLNFTHEFTENWQTRVYYDRTVTDRPSIGMPLLTSVDYVTGTIVTAFFDYDENFISTVYGTDNIGKYSVGPVNLQSNFGYLYDNREGTGKTYLYQANFITANLYHPADYNSYAPLATSRSKPDTFTGAPKDTFYFLETASLLNDRVIVNAGASRISVKQSDGKHDDTVKRAGALFKPVKDVSLYYSYSTMFNPTAYTTVDINGKRFPNVFGEGQEVGAKASFLDGRLTLTADYYWMKLSNLSTNSGLVNPTTGLGYYIFVGDQKFTGTEVDLQAQLTKNWQLIAVAWSGDTLNSTGKQADNSLKESAGFFTRYNFTEGAIKGLSIGGGTYFAGRRSFDSVGKYIPAFSTTNVFVAYQFARNWNVTANVSNVFDKIYVAGAWSAGDVDFGDPRSVRLTASYRFK